MPIPRIRFKIRHVMLVVLLVAALLGAFEVYRRREPERLLATQQLLLLVRYHLQAQTQAVAEWLSQLPPEPLPVSPAPAPTPVWFMADDEAAPPAPE